MSLNLLVVGLRYPGDPWGDGKCVFIRVINSIILRCRDLEILVSYLSLCIFPFLVRISAKKMWSHECIIGTLDQDVPHPGCLGGYLSMCCCSDIISAI